MYWRRLKGYGKELNIKITNGPSQTTILPVLTHSDLSEKSTRIRLTAVDHEGTKKPMIQPVSLASSTWESNLSYCLFL